MGVINGDFESVGLRMLTQDERADILSLWAGLVSVVALYFLADGRGLCMPPRARANLAHELGPLDPTVQLLACSLIASLAKAALGRQGQPHCSGEQQDRERADDHGECHSGGLNGQFSRLVDSSGGLVMRN